MIIRTVGHSSRMISRTRWSSSRLYFGRWASDFFIRKHYLRPAAEGKRKNLQRGNGTGIPGHTILILLLLSVWASALALPGVRFARVIEGVRDLGGNPCREDSVAVAQLVSVAQSVRRGPAPSHATAGRNGHRPRTRAARTSLSKTPPEGGTPNVNNLPAGTRKALNAPADLNMLAPPLYSIYPSLGGPFAVLRWEIRVHRPQ